MFCIDEQLYYILVLAVSKIKTTPHFTEGIFGSIELAYPCHFGY